MFSCFFAAYAVLLGQTAGGPTGAQLLTLRAWWSKPSASCFQASPCGMASIAAEERNRFWFQVAMGVTCIFGVAFLWIEFHEFADLVARGAGPSRSAFLSAFFTLVGCHGGHVSAGILWLLTMMAQVLQGLPPRDHSPADLLQPVLARAGHRLDRHFHHRLSAGERGMRARANVPTTRSRARRRAVRPAGSTGDMLAYLVGLGFSVVLTAAAFFWPGPSLSGGHPSRSR